MFYVTDASGLDWFGRPWDVGYGRTERNENYQFCAYPSPVAALFLTPFFERFSSPRLWHCSGLGLTCDEGLRSRWKELEILQDFPAVWPTDTQRITFGILCALSVSSHTNFREWAIRYLLGDHSFPSSLEAELLGSDSCGLLLGVLASLRDAFWSSCVCHGAYWDSGMTLDVPQLGSIVLALPPGDIAAGL